MAKQKPSSDVRVPVVAAPCEGETTMSLDQPAENDVYAGEEVVVVGNPYTTPNTSVDSEDARRESERNESTISPYAGSPVAIDCGPGLATYWVPKHLLRSPKWPITDAEGTLRLSGVSAATGHTLVHYLYTGTYQALGAKGEDTALPAHIRFEQALLTFVLAAGYDLSDLERLAKEQITMIGSCVAFVEVLNTARKVFSKMAWSWFHEYLQTRAKEQFNLNYTFFTSGAYIKSVGDGELHRFMTCHLLETFSEKLTLTLQRRKSRCLTQEQPDVVWDEIENAAIQTHDCSHHHDGHQTGMCTESDEMALEFPDVPCEGVDDVISLENPVWEETPPLPSELEPVPSPESAPPAECKSEPLTESELVKEEEEAERKKKEEDEAASAAAAAAIATNDLSWAESAPAHDDWGSFAAPVVGKKKKKGKKGKVDPTPPPPPPPPAGPPTTFDDIKLDDRSLDDGVSKIDMNFGDSGAAKTGSGILGSLSGWSAGWGSSTKASGWGGLTDSSKDAADGGDKPWASSDKKKKDASAFDFDFDAFKRSADAAPAAADKLPEDDGWGFGSTTTKSKKKGKKGALIDEPIPEPEPTPAQEPEKKEEYDPWAFSFGGAVKDKKKKKKGAVAEEPRPPPSEPEAPAEPEPAPASEPVKEEDPWGFATTAPGKKGKKGKKAKEELPPPPVEPEPVPEPEPEPEPTPPEPEPEPIKEEPAVDPFAGLSKSQKKKLQDKMKKEAKAKEEEDAKRKEEEDAAELVRLEEEAEAERIRIEEEEAEKKRIKEEEAAAAAFAAAEAEKKKDDAWADWCASAAPVKKSKKKKGTKVEEPPPPPPKPEPVIEPEPSPPVEEKSAEQWDDWGAAARPIKKSKKDAAALVPKEPVVEPEPEPEPDPVAEPEPEPEPVKADDEGGDWGFSSIWGGGKKNKKGKNVDLEPPPEPEPALSDPLAIKAAFQEPDTVEEPKAENEDEWGMPSWGKKKKDPKKGVPIEVTDDTTTPVPKSDEDDPWGSANFNISKTKKSKKAALVPELSSPPAELEPELLPLKEIEAPPPAGEDGMWISQGLGPATAKKKKKEGEVMDEPLTKTTSKESGTKLVKNMVENLISLDGPPPAEVKKEKKVKESQISSMWGAFGSSTKSTSMKKETPTEKRVRERRERKEGEEQERLDKENAAKDEEERIVREAEEAEAEAARIAEEEAEAETARIAAKAEVARLATKEEDRRRKEEEESSKSTGRVASVCGSSKEKVWTKDKKAREKGEKEEEELLAQEEADLLAAEEQARIEAEEEAEAARVAAEEEALLAPVFLKEKKEKKKNKKKGVAIEETSAYPSPPSPSVDPDADLFDLVKDIPENQLLTELGEDGSTELISATSSTLCPHLSYHILNGNRWRSCKRCYEMLKGISDQLVVEKKPVSHLE